MPRAYGKTSAASLAGSEISRATSVVSAATIKFDDLPITDKRQSIKCLQQQLFIVVSAMARGREWIGENDLEYRAQDDVIYPFIRKEVKNNLAAQIRRYVFIACRLFALGDLTEFRLQVVKVDSMEVIEELGFIFESVENENIEQETGRLQRKPQKATLIDSIASIEAARARVLNTIATFCKGAAKLIDQVQLPNVRNPNGPTVTVVPWFLCRQATGYFDTELENSVNKAGSAGGAAQRSGKKHGRADVRGGEEPVNKSMVNEGFHPFRRTAIADVSRLSGGTYVRMIQLKTAFHGLSVYAKVRKNITAGWGKSGK